jgi:DNA-binding MarR family transcriptional regulator
LSTVTSEPAGYLLPLRLLAGFRTLIDALNVELAQRGHPDLRPMHGFVFQAIGARGTSAVELARRLGISKQAAGKIIENLERRGYVRRHPDRADARSKIVTLTERGVDALVQSEQIFNDLRRQWADRIGADRLSELESDLASLTPPETMPLDVPGWFGGAA